MAYDVKYSPNRWRDEGDIVPGFGGVWPGDPDAETHHVRRCTSKPLLIRVAFPAVVGRMPGVGTAVAYRERIKGTE